jgi:mRNA-degrading endonuclease RelE of RelBE toxin-antitoxin system
MAFAWYELAVANGSENAVFPLAECYAKGLGTKKDMVKAIVYYTKAAYQSNLHAMQALIQYYDGNGDPQAAAHWQELLDEEDGDDDTTTPNNGDDDQEDDVENDDSLTTTDEKQAIAIRIDYENKSTVEKQIGKFNAKTQTRLRTTIKQFTKDPLNKEKKLNIKKLRDVADTFRIHVGDYRIIYKKENSAYVITSVERRSNATYKKM